MENIRHVRASLREVISGPKALGGKGEKQPGWGFAQNVILSPPEAGEESGGEDIGHRKYDPSPDPSSFHLRIQSLH